MLPSSFSGVERHLLSDHDFDYDKRDMGPIWVDLYKFGAPIEPSSSCQITETGECEGQYDAVLPPLDTGDASFSCLRNERTIIISPTSERSKRDQVPSSMSFRSSTQGYRETHFVRVN